MQLKGLKGSSRRATGGGSKRARRRPVAAGAGDLKSYGPVSFSSLG